MKKILKIIAIVFGGMFAFSTVIGILALAFETPEQRAEREAKLTQSTQNTKIQFVSEVQPQQNKQTTQPAVATQPAVVVPAIATLPTTTEKVASKYDVSCKIVGVNDGDTATCLTSEKRQIKIRFDQIDAPENTQDFGNASKKVLSDMIFGKTVNLDTKEQDKYGRTVAEVFVDDKNINKEMVALGMAWAYREYIRDNEYVELENKARRQSLGLWSQPNAIYPSDFRRGKRGEQSTPKQTQQIAKVQEQRDLADSGGQCGSKRTCKQMSSCSEAKHYLNVCGVSRLDRDGDGVPCESLCR